jgi:MFS family permease
MTTTEEPHPERPRLGRTVIALGIVSLLTDMSSEMAYTQVPIFLTRVLGAPAYVVGLIEGVAESTASLLKIVAGYISDRLGRRKPLIVLGYGCGAASKPLMALTGSWPFVLLLRFLDRFGKGLRTAPRDALIAETTPQAIRGRAFGLHRTMDTMGAVLGPLLGLWFLSRYTGSLGHQLRGLFVFAGLPGLLAVLTILFAVRERSGGATSAQPRAALELQRAARPPRLRWRDLTPSYRRFLIITLLFNLGNSSDAFLVLRAQKLGFAPQEILWLYAAFNVVEALLGYGAGILSDRVGRKPLIICGYFIFAGVYFGMALATTKAAIWALFLCYGLYYTFTQGVQRAFAADFADPAQRATQIGAYHTVVGCALLPASILAGCLFDRDPALPFFLGASTALTAAVLLLLFLPIAKERLPASGSRK